MQHNSICFSFGTSIQNCISPYPYIIPHFSTKVKYFKRYGSFCRLPYAKSSMILSKKCIFCKRIVNPKEF